MIKLIATDIDGTLVEASSASIDAEVPDTMHALIQKGILCVVASGRRFESIQNIFHQIQDEIVYIAENGAYISYQGEALSVTPMQKSYAEAIIKQLRQLGDGCEIEVSTSGESYVETDNQEFIDMLQYGYHNNVKRVKDILAEDVQITKVAVYRKAGIREIGEKILLPAWKDKVKTCISGEEWVDFMDPRVDKGHALRFLRDYFQIDRSETMAFGDNENDIGMLLEAAESYAVDSAREEVKASAKYICPPYWEKGVYQILKTLL